MNKNLKIALLIGAPILLIVFIVILLVGSGDDTTTTEDSSDTASDNNSQSSPVTSGDAANSEATERDPTPTDTTLTDVELQIANRNTLRNIDLNNLRAQFLNFTANNNGQLPTDDIESGQFHELVTHGYIIIFSHYADSTGNISATNVLDETIVGQNRILYTETTGPTVGTTLYPGVDEIHIWGGHKCGGNADGMLSGGNPSSGEVNKYTATDVLVAHIRDVAFVYQSEGEATARCADD